jgi:hypothetical protein
MDTADSPTKDSVDTTRTNPLLKTITTATLVLYTLGWGAALAWESRWETSLRASYGYQLGWVTCLAACAVALFVWRGHRAHGLASGEVLDVAETSTNKEPV